ncbi:MAG: triose-phosphate isomerase [Gemmatimonadales bacterium]
MAGTLFFAANWKMHLGPDEAREYARRFLARLERRPGREWWFFPGHVSLEALAAELRGEPATRVGAQDVHWETRGAFTGATSVPMARAAGASAALIGHSERRWVFGETEEQTGKKLRAVLDGGLVPMLCVGERLEERQRDETEAVVHRQLRAAVAGLDAAQAASVIVAYEPVWAIGTGKNATPADAAAVHRGIRAELRRLGAPEPRVLYGGSVSRGNVESFLAEPEIDGVLVGGASLEPEGWAEICSGNGERGTGNGERGTGDR